MARYEPSTRPTGTCPVRPTALGAGCSPAVVRSPSPAFAAHPARDFGPSLLAWFAGWGQVAIPGIHDYLWVPIVGPFVGGVLGAIVYDLFIRDVLRDRGESDAARVETEGRIVKEEPETT